MQSGVIPSSSAATSVEYLITLLQRCRQTKDALRAQRLLAYMGEHSLQSDALLGNYLVPLLADCGALPDAQQVFDHLPHRNVYSWTALISAYIDRGDIPHAFHLYHKMQHNCVCPNNYTFVAILRACSKLQDAAVDQAVHADIVRNGLDSDLFIGNTLVDLYGKRGSLAEARSIFAKIPGRDRVSWTALIAGYAEYGLGEEALSCFEKMQDEGFVPDYVTWACSLKGCISAGAVETGRKLHAQIIMRGLDIHLLVATTLLGMYGKYGLLAEGRQVFDKLPIHDVAAWNQLIKGYGENQEGKMAVQCFEEMQEHGARPNSVTFTCLLAACSHASLVLKGQEYFQLMKEHGIEPMGDHYSCMVDLFARSGQVYEAKRFIEGMRCVPSEESLRALLTGCKIHGEIELGLSCFQELVMLNREDAPAYLLMAGTYASAGRWKDAKRIEKMRKNAGAKKMAATAAIEVKTELHEFVVGHQQSAPLEAMLETLSLCMKYEGYIPVLETISKQRSDRDQEAISLEFLDCESMCSSYSELNLL